MKDLVIKLLKRTTDQELLDLLKQHSFKKLIKDVEKAKASTDYSFTTYVMHRFAHFMDDSERLANKKNITEWKNVLNDDESKSNFFGKLFEMVMEDDFEFDHKRYFILCLFVTVTILETRARLSFLELLEK